MSGGSHGYIFGRIEDELCGQMEDVELNDLIADVAKLAHDLEWYHSGDICKDDYKKSVQEFKCKWFRDGRPERLRGYIEEAIGKTRAELLDMILPIENHGARWIHKPDVYHAVYCSECDFELRIDNTKFCPNCGARMDGGE